MTDKHIHPSPKGHKIEAARVAVDFDGTIVDHAFPGVGKLIPGALDVIGEINDHGHQVVIWTCRHGCYLDAAVAFLKSHSVPFAFANHDPEWPPGKPWKEAAVGYKLAYTIAIDDRNLGIPLVTGESGLPVVDWVKVRTMLVSKGILTPRRKRK